MEKKKVNVRTLKLGSYQTALTLVVIAIAVALNLVVSALPVTWTKLDLSADALYTLSPTTEDLLSGLDRDISFYLIASSGQEDDRIQTLLSRYAAASSHISVETVDPVSRPTFTAQYTQESVADNSVIAVSEDGRSRLIRKDDIFTVDVASLSEEEQYYYQYYGKEYVTPNVFAGENALSSAVDYLLSDNLPKIYVLQGHGEIAMERLSEQTYNDLLSENIEFEDLTLSTTDSVPQDASAVLINLPASDLMDEELTRLQTYAQNGGNVLLITAPEVITGTDSVAGMKNLMAFARTYGLYAKEGLIYEGNSGFYYSGSAGSAPTVLLPQIGTSSPVAQKMKSVSTQILMPTAHPILRTEEEAENVTVYPLLTTTEDAYLKAGDSQTAEKEEGDLPGSFHVGAYAQNTENGSQLAWFSSYYIQISETGTGNEDMLLSTLLTLCGKESTPLSIDTKSIAVSSLTVSEQQQTLWGNVLMIGVPVAFVIVGLFIWLRRRRV